MIVQHMATYLNLPTMDGADLSGGTDFPFPTIFSPLSCRAAIRFWITFPLLVAAAAAAACYEPLYNSRIALRSLEFFSDFLDLFFFLPFSTTGSSGVSVFVFEVHFLVFSFACAAF